MKKTVSTVLIVGIIFFMFLIKVGAKTTNVYVFYGKTCPHCHEALEYLESIKDKYDINIYRYEVWYDEDSEKLMKEVSEMLDVKVKGVPFVVIDNTPIIGFTSGNTDNTYIYHIKKANNSSFVDKVGMKIGVVKKVKELKKSNNENKNIWWILKESSKECIRLSLFWSIITMMLILVNLKDRKKTIIISVLSLAVSLMVYMILLIVNKPFDNIINFINMSRIFLSLILMILGITGLVYILKKLDNKILFNISSKSKTVVATSLSNAIMIISIFISILNNGGISDVLNVYSDYNLIIKVLLCSIYFLVILIFYIIFILFIYKVFDIFKFFNKDNTLTLVISTIFILIISILLGIHPTFLIFN